MKDKILKSVIFGVAVILVIICFLALGRSLFQYNEYEAEVLTGKKELRRVNEAIESGSFELEKINVETQKKVKARADLAAAGETALSEYVKNQKELKVLKGQVAILQTDIDKKDKDLKKSQEELNKLRHSIAVASGEVEAITKKKSELVGRVDSLKAELPTLESAQQTLKENLPRLETLKKEISGAQEKLSVKQKEYATLEAKMVSANEAYKKAVEQKDALQNEVGQLQKEIPVLESAQRNLKQCQVQLAESEKSLQDTQTELQSKQRELAALQASVEISKKVYEKTVSQKKSLDDELIGVESKILRGQKKQSELAQTLADLETQIKQTKESLNMAKDSAASEQQRALDARKEANEKINVANAEAMKAVALAEAKQSAANDAVKSAQSKIEQAEVSARNRIREIDSRVAETEKTVRVLQTTALELNSDIKDARMRLNRLLEQCEAKSKALERISAEYDAKVKSLK